jgi:chromosome segregation ATPase
VELKTDVAGLKTDVAGLKTDVAGLKTDVAGLKTDVAGLKTDVAELKTDVAGLKDEQHRQGLMLEDLQGNVQRVLEALTPVLKKGERVDAHDAALERQAEDLAVTKSALRAHISDDKLHRRRP